MEAGLEEEIAYTKELLLVRIKMRIGVQHGLHGFMSQPIRDFQWGKAHFNQYIGVWVADVMYSYSLNADFLLQLRSIS